MKLLMKVEAKEVKGSKGVEFEVYDGSANVGTLIVGKGGIRWAAPKASVNARSRSWREAIQWLERGHPSSR